MIQPPVKFCSRNVLIICLIFVLAGVVCYYHSSGKENSVNQIVLKLRPLSSSDDVRSSAQDNSNLITYLKDNLIKGPSGKPYNLTNPKSSDYSGHGQGKLLPIYYANKGNKSLVHQILFKPLPPISFDDVKSSTQDDPNLITYLKDNLIKGPSGKPYNLTNPNSQDYSEHGQGKYFPTYYANKANRTFIEVGAYEGEKLSNTLNLELKLGWTGLLIEPIPRSFQILLTKHRKVTAAQCCLSDTKSPKEVSFKFLHNGSRIYNNTNNKDLGAIKSWCYPLYSLMVATGLTTIDLLCIDLEGFEIKVLETLPWDKVNIKAILIEHVNIPDGKIVVKNFLLKKGYTVVREFMFDFFVIKNSTI